MGPIYIIINRILARDRNCFLGRSHLDPVANHKEPMPLLLTQKIIGKVEEEGEKFKGEVTAHVCTYLSLCYSGRFESAPHVMCISGATRKGMHSI